MRLFFALWPDAVTRAALARAASQLVWRDGRRVPPENLHLTLHFLGTVADKAVPTVLNAAAQVTAPAFALAINTVGWWPRSRVAWLAPSAPPPTLIDLAGAARYAASGHGRSATQEVFAPHISLARAVRRSPGLIAAVAVPWSVTHWALLQSITTTAGTHYEVIASWPLQAAVSDESAPATVQ